MKKQKQGIFKTLKKWLKYIFILAPAVISFSIGVLIFKTSYILVILSHVIKSLGSIFMLEPKMSKNNLKVAIMQCKEMWSNYI